MLLLAATGFLYLCEQFHWFGFYERKGWTVLLAIAAMGIFFLLIFLWLLLALFFRWRFQFSIRLLLVLVVAVALPFSWLAIEIQQAREQEKTVDALMKSGCTVWYDCDGQQFRPFWLVSIRSPTTPPEWFWLIRLFGRDFFHHVDQVDFQHVSGQPDFSDAKLAQVMPQLSTLPALRMLSLQSFEFSNNALSPLEGLTGIKNLTIYTELDDEGLKHIAAMKQLETLNIRSSTVTDDDLTDLRREKPHLKSGLYLTRAARSARSNKSAKSPGK